MDIRMGGWVVFKAHHKTQCLYCEWSSCALYYNSGHVLPAGNERDVGPGAKLRWGNQIFRFPPCTDHPYIRRCRSLNEHKMCDSSDFWELCAVNVETSELCMRFSSWGSQWTSFLIPNFIQRSSQGSLRARPTSGVARNIFQGEKMVGVWGREPPVGSKGKAQVGGGRSPPEADDSYY